MLIAQSAGLQLAHRHACVSARMRVLVPGALSWLLPQRLLQLRESAPWQFARQETAEGMEQRQVSSRLTSERDFLLTGSPHFGLPPPSLFLEISLLMLLLAEAVLVAESKYPRDFSTQVVGILPPSVFRNSLHSITQENMGWKSAEAALGECICPLSITGAGATPCVVLGKGPPAKLDFAFRVKML